MNFPSINPAASSHAARPTVEWEEAACPLCGHDGWKLVIEAPDRSPGCAGLWFPVVQCQQCRLCYTNPRPSSRSLRQFYSESYKPHQPTPPEITRSSHRLWPGRAPDTVPLRGQGRLLDFGCGNGRFLARMQARGWQVMGVDASIAASARVRTHLGLPALTGSLPHPELTAGSFDLITMWQALEHVPNPLEVLRAARDLLAPGGQLLVTVPNIESLPFRWFGYAWCGLDLPRHLIHFSPRTLDAMLVQAGFRVHSLRMLRHASWLRSSAQLACQQSQPSTFQRLARWRLTSRLLTWYSYLTDQADCVMATAAPNAVGGGA